MTVVSPRGVLPTAQQEEQNMGKYFGTDGFRGEANVDLTVEHAYKVGRFLGWYYGQKTPDMKWAKLFISMDGKSWAEVPLKEDGSADIGGVIKGIRLLNASSSPQEVTLEEFRLNLANKGGKSADSGAAGDFNLATFLPVELSPERAEIPCDFPRAGSVIVLSDGKEASVLACGADGRWVPVGNLAKGRKVNTFSLKSVKKPVKALGLTGKKGSSVNIFEVIWK